MIHFKKKKIMCQTQHQNITNFILIVIIVFQILRLREEQEIEDDIRRRVNLRESNILAAQYRQSFSSIIKKVVFFSCITIRVDFFTSISIKQSLYQYISDIHLIYWQSLHSSLEVEQRQLFSSNNIEVFYQQYNTLGKDIMET